MVTTKRKGAATMPEKDRIKLVVWGTGGFAGNILSYNHMWLKNVEIVCFVSNGHTPGTRETFLGKKVISPNEMKNEKWDYIVILSTFFDEIRTQIIDELKIHEEKIISLEKLALNLSKEKEVSIIGKKVLLYGKNYSSQNYVYHLKQRVEKLNIIDDGTCKESYTKDLVKLSEINDEAWDYILLLDGEGETEDILKEKIKKTLKHDTPVLISSQWLCNLAFEHHKVRKKSGKFYYSLIPVPKCGLMALLIEFMRISAYALSKGYLPFIDMQNSLNMYLEDDKLGEENSWEYYFTQTSCVSGKSLKEIYENENIIIPSMYLRSTTNIDVVNNIEARTCLRENCQRLIKIQDEVIKKIYAEYQRTFEAIEGKTVIGCIYRGTDYKNVKPANHMIQPDLDELAEALKKYMKTWNCEYIFLATEDEDALGYLKEVFTDKLLYINQLRYRNTGDKFLAEIENDRPNDRYLRGLEYLTAMFCLTKCNYLISGRNSGLNGALLLRENDFDDMYIFIKEKYSAENKSFL